MFLIINSSHHYLFRPYFILSLALLINNELSRGKNKQIFYAFFLLSQRLFLEDSITDDTTKTFKQKHVWYLLLSRHLRTLTIIMKFSDCLPTPALINFLLYLIVANEKKKKFINVHSQNLTYTLTQTLTQCR